MAAYAAAHAKPRGPGDARPKALQIVKDNEVEEALSGKVIVITGASSGVGLETARALVATGATLILTVRDIKRAEHDLNDILAPDRVFLVHMDLASFSSVRSAAATILEKSNNQVNILICNAAVLGFPTLTMTEDGNELHFQTNHLSHFLLFQLLKPALLASSTPAFHSRVVAVSSSSHRTTTLPPSDDYAFEKGGYNGRLAYARSKIANIYMANEIERRYAAHGLHGLSANPGVVTQTKIARHMAWYFPITEVFGTPALIRLAKNGAQGAATTVLAAVGREWEGRGGVYLEDCAEAERGKDDWENSGKGWVGHTFDEGAEGRVWRESLELVREADDS